MSRQPGSSTARALSESLAGLPSWRKLQEQHDYPDSC